MYAWLCATGYWYDLQVVCTTTANITLSNLGCRNNFARLNFMVALTHKNIFKMNSSQIMVHVHGLTKKFCYIYLGACACGILVGKMGATGIFTVVRPRYMYKSSFVAGA